MKKRTIVLIIIVAVVVVIAALAFVAFTVINNKQDTTDKPSAYSAVYLTTGDIYFGKVDWSSWPKMTNVWYIQRTVDAKQQTQTGIAPLKSAFWSPMDEIKLNTQNIIFWTKIKAGSELAKALDNPTTMNPQAQQQAQQYAVPPAQTDASSTQAK